MSIRKRIEQTEQQLPRQKEPQFISWIGHPWTKEEKAEALRKCPDGTCFLKPLSATQTTEEQLTHSTRNPDNSAG